MYWSVNPTEGVPVADQFQSLSPLVEPSGSLAALVGLNELPAVTLVFERLITGAAFWTVTITVSVLVPPFPSLAARVKVSVLLVLLVRFGAVKVAFVGSVVSVVGVIVGGRG